MYLCKVRRKPNGKTVPAKLVTRLACLQEHSHQRSEQHGGLSAEANRSAIGETPDLIRKSSSGGHPDNTPQRQLPVDRRTNIVDCRAAGSDPGQRNAIKVVGPGRAGDSKTGFCKSQIYLSRVA